MNLTKSIFYNSTRISSSCQRLNLVSSSNLRNSNLTSFKNFVEKRNYTTSEDEKKLVHEYRRAKKIQAGIKQKQQVLTRDIDTKIAKHVKIYPTTVVLTNGATVNLFTAYWNKKYLRLEECPVSIAKAAKQNILPVREVKKSVKRPKWQKKANKKKK